MTPLERAKEILERQPSPEELAEDEARRERLRTAAPIVHCDLADLQQKWVSGQDLTDEEFKTMRRLEAEESARQKVAPRIVQKEAPPMVRKVNENALQPATNKHPTTESEQQIIEKMKSWAAEMTTSIMKEVRSQNTTSRQIGEAVASLVAQIALVSIANQVKRAELERRIEALEKQLKPRVRVAAISERTAP